MGNRVRSRPNDKPLQGLDRPRRFLFFFHRFAAQFRTALEESLYPRPSTAPGRIALARMPNSPSSMESVLAKPISAHLVAE
jgi:hypothetical protein